MRDRGVVKESYGHDGHGGHVRLHLHLYLITTAGMPDRGVIKESCGHDGHGGRFRLHLHLITTAGMPAALGLVHTIVTCWKVATFIGIRIRNVLAYPGIPRDHLEMKFGTQGLTHSIS